MPPDYSSPRLSLRDLAKRIGVSHATVSLALRDHPRISPALRARIKAAAEELGYRPDPMLSALASYAQAKDRRPVVSALAWLNRWSKPNQLRCHREFEAYWQGANAAAEVAGYRLEEFAWRPTQAMEGLQKILLTREIRGVLIPPHPDGANWEGFDWSEFSAVRFGYSLTEPAVPRVATDMVANSALAFQKMTALGYERIGFVGDPALTRARFLAGFNLGQLTVPSEQRLPHLLLAPRQADVANRAFQTWMKEHRPDAILTEVAALAAMLKTAGYRVPEDVGLATLSVRDGNADAGIEQNGEAIGQAGAELVIGLINRYKRGLMELGRTMLVEGSWVDGQTLPERRAEKFESREAAGLKP